MHKSYNERIAYHTSQIFGLALFYVFKNNKVLAEIYFQNLLLNRDNRPFRIAQNSISTDRFIQVNRGFSANCQQLIIIQVNS